jgi:predicted hydrocarbon binding protein
MQPSNGNESNRVDAYLSLLTTINKGMVELLGPASKGLIFGTGVEEGRRIARNFPKTDTIQKAIQTLNEAYVGVWSIELYVKEGESHFFLDALGQPSFNVLVRDCPIRAAVEKKNMEQCGPICYLTNGYLCGMLSEILDEKVGIDIEYAGPLACKKRIFFRV